MKEQFEKIANLVRQYQKDPPHDTIVPFAEKMVNLLIPIAGRIFDESCIPFNAEAKNGSGEIWMGIEKKFQGLENPSFKPFSSNDRWLQLGSFCERLKKRDRDFGFNVFSAIDVLRKAWHHEQSGGESSDTRKCITDAISLIEKSQQFFSKNKDYHTIKLDDWEKNFNLPDPAPPSKPVPNPNAHPIGGQPSGQQERSKS